MKIEKFGFPKKRGDYYYFDYAGKKKIQNKRKKQLLNKP